MIIFTMEFEKVYVRIGYCEKVCIYSFMQDENGCSIPVRIPVNEDGKALKKSEGFFDQIDKDLNVILGW